MTVKLLRKRLFTSEEYHRLTQVGILSEEDRVELIEGEIIEMSPIGSRHAACVKRLNRLFSLQVGQRALVSVQDPIYLDQRSEPQPDLALLQPRLDFYIQAHPQPQEVLLVVEVAETSVEVDRQVKVPLYARSSIPEVWLVDLVTECIEVYLKPLAQSYETVQRFQRGQYLSIQVFPDLEIAVNDVFG
jgi:Uma2 family endonuclease